MRSSMLMLSFFATAGVVLPAAAQTLPRAGLWEFSVSQEGGPMGSGGSGGGGEPRTGKACLAADALAAAPEKTLIEAGAGQAGGNRAAPKCEFRDVKREGANSSWRASCTGPRGAMEGSGSGTLGADSAQLQQTFSIKAAFGTMTMKQTVNARRTGEC